MAKYCKYCGSLLDDASGKCPICDKTEVAKKAAEVKDASSHVQEEQKQLSKKEMKAEKKRLKKQ